MIIFNKLYKKNKQHFISFMNDKGWEVSIPIDHFHADRISLYLEQIAKISHPFNLQEEEDVMQEEEEDNL
jgi:hypothetical protein